MEKDVEISNGLVTVTLHFESNLIDDGTDHVDAWVKFTPEDPDIYADTGFSCSPITALASKTIDRETGEVIREFVPQPAACGANLDKLKADILSLMPIVEEVRKIDGDFPRTLSPNVDSILDPESESFDDPYFNHNLVAFMKLYPRTKTGKIPKTVIEVKVCVNTARPGSSMYMFVVRYSSNGDINRANINLDCSKGDFWIEAEMDAFSKSLKLRKVEHVIGSRDECLLDTKK